MMEISKLKVYVKVNENNEIIAINSSIFLENADGWIEIDSGDGDKYAHAQVQYLDKRVRDEHRRYNYKLIDDKVVEIADEDKPAIEVVQEVTAEERIAALEKELNVLLGMEMYYE